MRSAIPFGVRRVLAALLFVAPIVLSQLAAAPAAAGGSDAREPDYLTSPDLRSRALDAIFDEIGTGDSRGPDATWRLLVQGPPAPLTDAWRGTFRFLHDRDAVLPSPTRATASWRKPKELLRSLRRCITDFDVVGRASGGFEDPRMSGRRDLAQHQILPERTYGDVR